MQCSRFHLPWCSCAVSCLIGLGVLAAELCCVVPLPAQTDEATRIDVTTAAPDAPPKSFWGRFAEGWSKAVNQPIPPTPPSPRSFSRLFSSSKPSPAETLFVQGVAAEREGRHRDAEPIYLAALQQVNLQTSKTKNTTVTVAESDSVAGHINHRLAVVSSILGRPYDADAYFQRAIQDRRPEVRYAAALEYASFCEQFERLDRAEILWRNILLEYPEATAVETDLARILMKQGRYQEAIRYTMRTVGERETYRQIAIIAQRRGDDGVAEYALARLQPASRSPASTMLATTSPVPHRFATPHESVHPAAPTSAFTLDHADEKLATNNNANNISERIDALATDPASSMPSEFVAARSEAVERPMALPARTSRFYHYTGDIPPRTDGQVSMPEERVTIAPQQTVVGQRPQQMGY